MRGLSWEGAGSGPHPTDNVELRPAQPPYPLQTLGKLAVLCLQCWGPLQAPNPAPLQVPTSWGLVQAGRYQDAGTAHNQTQKCKSLFPTRIFVFKTLREQASSGVLD